MGGNEMSDGMEGLRVLITAGANGIGRHTAEQFQAKGAKVHICDVDGDALSRMQADHPGISQTPCDVADRDQVAKLIDDAASALGGIDVLVNNAGIAGPTGRVDEIDPADWDRCLDVCITGMFNVTRLAIPHLKAAASASDANVSIANLSSAAGKFGFPLRAPYAAAKWGVVGFTKTLAVELGEHGIRANAILPGPVDGERIRQVIGAKARAANISFDDMQSKMVSHLSLKTLIPPQEIAGMIVYLASPVASTVSGQAISVDGDTQSLT
jgi:NAD(P)-dependent dehydrogenase (short-subunit alcohol dehydrogenase family)